MSKLTHVIIILTVYAEDWKLSQLSQDTSKLEYIESEKVSQLIQINSWEYRFMLQKEKSNETGKTVSDQFKIVY